MCFLALLIVREQPCGAPKLSEDRRCAVYESARDLSVDNLLQLSLAGAIIFHIIQSEQSNPNKLKGFRMQVKAMRLTSRSDVTGILCVAQEIARGLFASVRPAEDIVE
jgi:hypothetical protein